MSVRGLWVIKKKQNTSSLQASHSKWSSNEYNLPHYGVDSISMSYIRLTVMNTETSDGFSPPRSSHEPSTWCSPILIPGCLPFPGLVLPFPCWLLSLPYRVPSYVLNSGTTCVKAFQKVVQIKEWGDASPSLWEAMSTGPDAAGWMPTGRHAVQLHKFLLGTFVWERGLLQLILCLRKEIVKTLPAEERGEWKSGVGITLSTCKEQWFNETAGWSMMELDRIPKRKWREAEEAKENWKSTLFK